MKPKRAGILVTILGEPCSASTSIGAGQQHAHLHAFAIDALNPDLSHVNSSLPCQNCCPKSEPIVVVGVVLALA